MPYAPSKVSVFINSTWDEMAKTHIKAVQILLPLPDTKANLAARHFLV